MSADGTQTLRLHEKRPVPARIRAPFGQTITPVSGLVDIYQGQFGSTQFPLNPTPISTNIAVSSFVQVNPTSVKAVLDTSPTLLSLSVDQLYTFVFKLTIVALSSTYVFEPNIVVTIAQDAE